MKRLIRTVARKFGYEIRRARNTNGRGLIDFIESRGIDAVFDVGANTGQFAQSLRAAGYRGKIVSFEPVRSAYKTLESNACGDPNWAIFNYALGAHEGEESIHVSKATDYSSILRQTPHLASLDSAAKVTHSEQITVRRFDDVFPSLRKENNFLKIDTQGFDEQILAGASKALPFLAGVQLELSIVPLYENTWSIDSAIAFMARAGFTVSQIAPVNFRSDDPVSLIEIDCLFRRT